MVCIHIIMWASFSQINVTGKRKKKKQQQQEERKRRKRMNSKHKQQLNTSVYIQFSVSFQSTTNFTNCKFEYLLISNIARTKKKTIWTSLSQVFNVPVVYKMLNIPITLTDINMVCVLCNSQICYCFLSTTGTMKIIIKMKKETILRVKREHTRKWNELVFLFFCFKWKCKMYQWQH